MTEETEIPEVCKKYDVLSDEIGEIKNHIKTLQNDNKGYKKQLKEAIGIVAEAEKIGEKSEYFRKQIQELDKKLLDNDAAIKDNLENLQIYNRELEEILEKLEELGWVKTFDCFPLARSSDRYKWMQKETWAKYSNSSFISRIV